MKSRRGLATFLMLLQCAVGAASVQSALAAESDRNAENAAGQLQVICAADIPVAHPGDSITVRAWALDSTGAAVAGPIKWTWMVSFGNILGGEVANWTFDEQRDKGLAATLEVAEVTADSAALGRARCVVEINFASLKDWLISCKDLPAGADCKSLSIINPLVVATRGRYVSGRALLVSGLSEPAGYGLYSYLLIESPAADHAERTRHLSAIESHLRLIQPSAEMERYRRRSRLNLALIPVKEVVDIPQNLSDPEQLTTAAEHVLSVYDYARAQSILADLESRAIRSGPYLISRLPSGLRNAHVSLFFDMSRVAPKLINDWIRTFHALANKESSWSDVTLSRLALNTRNVLAAMARDTPEVVEKLKEWIDVIKP